MSKAATLRLFPGIRQDKLTGAAQWYDYQMVEADRLTLAFAAAADRAGADIVNYVEAVAPIRDRRPRLGHGGARRADRGDLLHQCACWSSMRPARAPATIMRVVRRAATVPLLKAMNLVTSKPASDIALAAPTSKGRMLTLVPVARPGDRRHRPV